MNKNLEQLKAECQKLIDTYPRTETQHKRLEKLQEWTGMVVCWRSISTLTFEIVEGATRGEMLAKIWQIDCAWMTEQRKNKQKNAIVKRKTTKKKKDISVDALATYGEEEEFAWGYS